MLITKTAEHRDVEANQHDVSSSLIESENVAQAVDDFAKQLKFVQKPRKTQLTFTVNAESNAVLISFYTYHQLM